MNDISSFTTSAILLKRINFGDYDLILTIFTQTQGKITVIAKSARKSRRRFCGAIDLFSLSQLVFKQGRGRLPALQEASVLYPFSHIRSDIIKTAYACYFAEIVHHWMEPNAVQTQVFDLLYQVLDRLDSSRLPDEILSIVFQMALLTFSGISPCLDTCCLCHAEMNRLNENRIRVNITKGGIICNSCGRDSAPGLYLSRAAIKQLQWMECGNWNKISRIRFSSGFIQEALKFLEVFVPYHLGKEPRSLSVLQKLRNARSAEPSLAIHPPCEPQTSFHA